MEEVPQKETTPFHPYSPYAVAKQYGFWIVKEYREAYGMFAVNGILFNHESERRGENFVTRKITLAAGRIAEGLQNHLELGNMDSPYVPFGQMACASDGKVPEWMRKDMTQSRESCW